MSTLSTTNLKNPSSGSNNIVLNADGTTTVAAPSNLIKSGTVNAGGTNPFPATGGPTAVDFTGIPSWVKRVTVMFNGVSTSGTSNYQVQLGTSAGIDATATYNGAAGFGGSSATTFDSTGFLVYSIVAASQFYSGTSTLTLLSSNTWTQTGLIAASTTNAPVLSGGSKALSGTLDRVRITTVNGTDTFDAGSINIMYE